MASPTTHTEYAHIVHTPELLSGEARIDGHRIRVRDVVAARDLGGMTPEEIAATVYPSLTLAQVYAALAWYYDHQPQMDVEIEQQEARLRSLRDSVKPSSLQRRLAVQRGSA